MTLTQITEKGIKDGEIINADINASAAIASSKLAKPIDLDDNEQIRLGTGNDLEIYHNGTNSYIDNHQGDLYIRGQDDHIVLQPVDGESAIVCDPNGAVNLYHDNSKKLETQNTGIHVTGDVSITGDYLADDNEKLKMGDGFDLQIYHDGSNSYIKDAGTGGIYLDTTFLHVRQGSGESMINAVADAQVELYYNNSKKFETTSTGTKFTGKLSAFDGSGSAGSWIALGDSDDLQIYHDGSNSYIKDAGTGQLRILSNQLLIQNAAGDANQIICTESGSVDLHYNGSKKFETTSQGAKVLNSDNTVLTLGNSSYDDGVIQYYNGGVYIKTGASSGDRTLNFYTAGSNRMVINSSGQVAIGTTSPGDANLAIKGTTNAYGGAGNSTTLVGAKLILEDDQGRKVSFWAPRSGEGAIGSITNHDFVVVTGNAEKARFSNNTGNFSLASGNLVIGTSGKGIDFSATSGTGTSELFDDYEKGTFNPEFGGTSSHGSFTYNNQDGYYTKIGNVVHIQIYVKINQVNSSGSGVAVIKGLPFGVDNVNNLHVGFGVYSGFSSYIPSYGVLNNSADTIYIKRHDSGSSFHAWMSTNDLANGTFLVLNFTYQTND